ncbi:MAG: dienelactone hydrolase family protein [Burkholderiales bacterium]|nr:dienelactone hydrolase family protein [Burkholderiales bacterium]
MTVTAQWIDLDPARPGYQGYLALPPAGRGPGLLLLQEIFGVNAHIRAVAQQYALDGFVVLAPDVFWRQTPRVDLGYVGADRERALALMQSLQPAEAGPDLAAALAALKARPECSGRSAALGYCMGGRLAWMLAAQGGLEAAVAYYGGGIQNQLTLAPAITCPMQFHYAGEDPHIPLDAVESVRAAMTHKPAELFVYEGAQHGFNCWARASHGPAAAALAHGRTLQFLSVLF